MSNDDGPAWLETPWYRSLLGGTVLGLDILLTLGLVTVTVPSIVDQLDEIGAGPTGAVPLHIYAVCVLGALGYVFTLLIEDFHRTTGKFVQANLRLIAALPLGAGMYLLADVLVGDTSGPLLVGIVFLSGLYVNLAYARLGALARRLLPASEEDETPQLEDESAHSSGR